MDAKVTEHFADIVDSARTVFEQIAYRTDISPKRAILNLQGVFGPYRMFVTEIISDDIRKYRYYAYWKTGLKQDLTTARILVRSDSNTEK